MLFAKKTLGIEIASDCFKMVLVEGGEKALRLDACSVIPFPLDMMRFSSREQNVKKPKAFVAAIREAHLKFLTKSRRIAVSLPDTIGSVVLLDVETRFKNREEGADVIRWKLKKNFPFDINEAHLDYQILQEMDSGSISLLVSIIAKQVINQYEELFIESGLEPNFIDFTPFNLYRLFSHRLEMAENALLVLFYNGVMTLLVFYSGILTFYRSKAISAGVGEENRMYRELNSSLLVYKDKYPNYTINEIFCMTSGNDVEVFRTVVKEATGIEPVLLDVERVVISKNDLLVDKKTLHSLTAALGAAVRNL